MPAKPALRTELLFYLSFLAAAALLVGVATMLLATSFAPERTFVLVLLMVALEVGVFIVFGRYLVSRLVLWPLERVVARPMRWRPAIWGGARRTRKRVILPLLPSASTA